MGIGEGEGWGRIYRFGKGVAFVPELGNICVSLSHSFNQDCGEAGHDFSSLPCPALATTLFTWNKFASLRAELPTAVPLTQFRLWSKTRLYSTNMCFARNRVSCLELGQTTASQFSYVCQVPQAWALPMRPPRRRGLCLAAR